MNKNTIILLGPQGSGKGTQAKILAQKLNIPHISTGDLFRLAIDSETEMGKQVKEAINSGQLAPDDLTFKILKERLINGDCANGYILDGYPRTVNQAELLDELVEVNKVIEIYISKEESIKRLTNRRMDPKTGKIYNLYTAPKPTPDIASSLIQRDDDKEEAIKKRLESYYTQTEPLIEFYKNKLIKIDGKNSIEKIAENITKILNM